MIGRSAFAVRRRDVDEQPVSYRDGDEIMKRILLTVAYDGTDFHGFAAMKYESGAASGDVRRQVGSVAEEDDTVHESRTAQRQTVRTVEDVLNDALTHLTGEEVTVMGASRTDAGVHAYGNLAAFDTASTIPPERFSHALNTVLPPDVRIVSSREVPPSFHPRRMEGAKKTYEYRIRNGAIPYPTERRYVYHYRSPLDVRAMHAAAQALTGVHDFTSFCNAQSQAKTRVREIFSIAVTEAEASLCGEPDRLIVLRVTGSGFLYHMVRIIAGTLIDVGRGHIPPDRVAEILAARNRAAAGPTAEPQGLFLTGYEIPEALFRSALPDT